MPGRSGGSGRQVASHARPLWDQRAQRPGAAPGPGAGDTHAGRHIPPRGRQQLQGRADAGEQLGARQAPQHGLGAREAPGHEPEAGARLRGPDGVREARARDPPPPPTRWPAGLTDGRGGSLLGR